MNCPAELFFDLWIEASQWMPSDLASSREPNPQFKAAISQHLKEPLPRSAACLAKAMLVEADDAATRRGKVIELMQQIDAAMLRIHPRTVGYHTATLGDSNWLRLLRNRRTTSGNYYARDGRAVIPKGPITRKERASGASSAECLADHFCALSVAPKTVHFKETTLPVEHFVIGRDAIRGVVDSKYSQPDISLGFVPIATKPQDFCITSKSLNGRIFAHYSASSTIEPAKTILAAISSSDAWDIALAPEFAVAPAEIDVLAEGLTRQHTPPRLLVAGTGNSIQQDANGLAWNEAHVLNGCGKLLWKQRKIWPAGVEKDRAMRYGISSPTHDLTLEASASGDSISICDVDSLGRCLILICQDLTTHDLAVELLTHYQPDWVFVPILDTAADPGRWAHQHAFMKSDVSPSYIAIVSSTALPDPSRTDPRPCGLVIGPRDKTPLAEARQVEPIYAGATVPAYAELRWPRNAKYKTVVTIAPAKA